MNKLVPLVLLSVLPLLGQATTNITDLSWMAGDWGPEAAGQKVASDEHWIAPAAGMMLGVSRTIAGGKVVEFEFLRIEARADGLYYVAQPGGKAPVAFKLMKSTKDSVVFENPQHDHPKIIEYRVDGTDRLVAAIEGDEGGKHKRQVFRFARMKAGN